MMNSNDDDGGAANDTAHNDHDGQNDAGNGRSYAYDDAINSNILILI